MPKQIKVSSATQAWQLTQNWLQTAYAEAKFVAYLKDATLVYFEAGHFVFELPSEQIAGILNRRSEKLAIQRALEVYMPKALTVTVEFTVAQAVQHG